MGERGGGIEGSGWLAGGGERRSLKGELLGVDSKHALAQHDQDMDKSMESCGIAGTE